MHIHSNIPLNRGFSKKTWDYFKTRWKIGWLLERVLRNLRMPTREYQPSLSLSGCTKDAIIDTLYSLWKNYWTWYSMVYTLSSKVASSIKEPRLSWWCIRTISYIWLMHPSNGHWINVLLSVWTVDRQREPGWDGFATPLLLVKVEGKARICSAFNALRQDFKNMTSNSQQREGMFGETITSTCCCRTAWWQENPF